MSSPSPVEPPIVYLKWGVALHYLGAVLAWFPLQLHDLPIGAVHITEFESGLMGAVVGAVVSSGFLLFQQGRAAASARTSAMAALEIELEHTELVAANPKEIAFTPIPNDVYVQALPYLAKLDRTTLERIVDAAIAISAYNANALFFQTHGALDPSWENRAKTSASSAGTYAFIARQAINPNAT